MPNHAIVIGINNYPGLRPLKGACNDATEFLKWVTHPGPGNVDPQHIHKLLSSEFEQTREVSKAKPVSDQIKEKFYEICNDNPYQHVGDRLYVFVAGHGMSDTNRKQSVALIAANATLKGITVPHVVVTDLIEFFRLRYTFKEIILIMDCCLDSSVLRPLDVTGTLQGDPHRKASKVRLFIAQATLWNMKSFEKEFNGKTRGIFSFSFMEALAKAPIDGQKVTGEAVKKYIEHHIKTISDEDIEPYFYGPGYEKVVFYKRNSSQAKAFTIRIRIENTTGSEVVELFGGALRLLDSKSPETNFVEFRVAPGLFKVAIQGTDRVKLIEVVNDCEEIL